MATKQSNDFVHDMHLQMGLNLDASLDWTTLVHCLDDSPSLEWASGTSLMNTIDRIEEHKSHESRSDAMKHQALYDLFLGQLLEGILKDPVELERHYQRLPALMRTWTNQGSTLMSDNMIQRIGPLYQAALVQTKAKAHFHNYVHTALIHGLYHGPQLWPYAKDIVQQELQATLIVPRRLSHLNTMGYKLLYRFEPHLLDYTIDEKYKAYAAMCGINEETYLEPSQVQTIFTGAHHNCTAWLMAIDLCMEERYKRYTHDHDGFVMQWKVIEERLSTLSFDPRQKSDWALWMLLETRRQDAPIIESVYTTLSHIHTEMHQAYTTYWPLVSGMFEDEEEQQEMAAQYYSERHHTVETNDFTHMEFES